MQRAPCPTWAQSAGEGTSARWNVAKRAVVQISDGGERRAGCDERSARRREDLCPPHGRGEVSVGG